MILARVQNETVIYSNFQYSEGQVKNLHVKLQQTGNVTETSIDGITTLGGV